MKGSKKEKLKNMFPIKMRMKKTGDGVEVYGFVNDKAVCFDLGKYKNQNQGMFLTDLKALVPYDAYVKKEVNIGGASAKARVKLMSAVWACTDGEMFTCHENAIDHEVQIMLREAALADFEASYKEEE